MIEKLSSLEVMTKCLIFLFVLTVTSQVCAYEIRGSLFLPKNRVERHFDKNQNGQLDSIEREYLKTYQKFQWQLAHKKRYKKYDINGDMMLSPIEWQNYLKDKKKKRTKKPGIF